MSSSDPSVKPYNPYRGDRLRRWRWDRLYWHLRCLRGEVEAIRDQYLCDHRGYLVDFGCGNMPYRSILEPCVDRYQGADLHGNPLADLTVDAQGCIPELADQCADFVLSNQVLEHVPDPVAYLAEARRVLAESGLLILSTHGVWRYHPDPTDYWRWTSAGLRKVIEKQGFEILRFSGLMSPPTAALQLFQDATCIALPGFLQPIYCLPFQILMQLFDFLYPEKLRQQDAAVYFVVARKGT